MKKYKSLKKKKYRRKKTARINKNLMKAGFDMKNNSNIYRNFANPKTYFISENIKLPKYINTILKSNNIKPKGLNYRFEIPSNIFSN